MPSKACIDAMLAELRPAEPLDDTARRGLDELVRLRAKHGMDDHTFFCHNLDAHWRQKGRETTAELDHFREIEAQHQQAIAERNALILARQQGQFYWEEKFAILVVLWTALRFFI